jgi:hypothetical protein
MLFRLPSFRRHPTFKDLALEWQVQHEGKHSPKWRKESGRLLAGHVLPALGAQRADKVARKDVSALLERTTSDASANHTKAIISRVFSWSIETGRFDCQNPAQGLKKRRLQPRERTLTDGLAP